MDHAEEDEDLVRIACMKALDEVRSALSKEGPLEADDCLLSQSVCHSEPRNRSLLIFSA